MNLSKYIKLIPLAGICLFIVLYIVAAIVYSGGHHLDQNSKGFSILHNYWCDLLNPLAQNGEINTSRSCAVTATVLLCSSLIFFWYYLPEAFSTGWFITATIRISGIAAMIIAMFIFTDYHGEAITWSGLFGGIAFVTTFVGLYKSQWYRLILFGVVCLIFGALTFAIYKTRIAINILPMIQKITLLLCLLWIALIDIRMRRITENSK